jgi:hypothetical protein
LIHTLGTRNYFSTGVCRTQYYEQREKNEGTSGLHISKFL